MGRSLTVNLANYSGTIDRGIWYDNVQGVYVETEAGVSLGGSSQLMLPDGNLYQNGATVILTAAQYQQLRPSDFSYLTDNGYVDDPGSPASRGSSIIWTNVASGSGPTISSNGNSGLLNVESYGFLSLLVALVGTPTGTTPGIVVTVYSMDSQGNQYSSLGVTTTLNASGDTKIDMGPGFTPNATVPQFVKLTWTVSGTTPSFPNAQITLIGR